MKVLKTAFRNRGDFLVITDDPKIFSAVLPAEHEHFTV